MTKGKRTPAILHGHGPPMAKASMLLKGYGACLCYQVYPQNYIFDDEGSSFALVADALRLKKLALLEVSNVLWVIKHHI